MKLLFYPSDGEKNIQVMLQVVKKLAGSGVLCCCSQEYSERIPEANGLSIMEPSKAEALCDILVSIGGDGATLRNAQRSIGCNKPLFSINTGRVGYLSAFDSSNADEISPETILALRESSRMLLDFSFSGGSEHYIVVNDVVIQRNYLNNTVELNLMCGTQAFSKVRADGIVIATPTGSTAYSLSAGGPIADPDMNGIIFTPICAHNFASRSLILGEDKTVVVHPTKRENNTSAVLIDGTYIGELHSRSKGFIKVSEKKLRLLLSENRSFFGILNRELSEKE